MQKRGTMDRRTLLKSAAATGAGAIAASSLLTSSPASAATSTPSANPFQVLKYRTLVPEIFAPLADAPSYTPAVIIGSGFGGAVAALRLASAGIQCTVLERGSRWPIPDPKRDIFTTDTLPDGRGFWRQTGFTGVTGIPLSTDYFGGVLDVVKLNGIDVWRGTGVGGGSIVYTGAHPVPRRDYFEHLFGSTVSYDEMLSTYYPRAATTLGTSLMPDDIYNSGPYSQSRVWDKQVAKAGYTSSRIPGIWNWDIMRQELKGTVKKSATISESNYGNSNGVKRGLMLNYLKYAENTGKATIFPGHEVLGISQDPSGKYLIEVQKVDPTGTVLSTRTIACDQLILAAGSIGTTELLMKARANGDLANLNEYVGTGWGTNGDAAVVRSFTGTGGWTQGAASASMISDTVNGMPVTMENWFVPGLPIDIGIIGSLGMTLDDHRADFSLDSSGKLALTWGGQPDTVAALDAVNSKIADASGVNTGAWPFSKSINDFFTAHPLGGAIIGKVTDNYGRVIGHQGLYVMDSALIPGNSGAVNPSITITALAERNLENIIANGG
jgi:cholesterol oxidase